uniref:ATP synthase complex subunit 8 n=2 Tax=Varanus salvator TaxID=62051 RepID=A0A0U4WAH7_VARSL|nr:ATP synthase F0 subunit 8 [Varanus salvator]BAU25941.1 ATP synthase F0 subunit 8 [Varanus salvator komaini]
MPQLNPNPWFLIMALTWLSLTLLFLTKLLLTTLTNPPSPHLNTPSTPNWTWPWT